MQGSTAGLQLGLVSCIFVADCLALFLTRQRGCDCTLDSVPHDSSSGYARGDFGRLGHGSCSDCFVPHPIKALSGKSVIGVACGDTHTIAMTSDGSLYGFGRNQNGQLGLGNSTDAVQPVLIQAMKVPRHRSTLKSLSIASASHLLSQVSNVCCLICITSYTHKPCLLSASVSAASGMLVSLTVVLLL